MNSNEVKENEPEESVPLNEEELEALAQLKAEFKQAEIDSVSEFTLIRFIRGYWREANRHEDTVENFRQTLAFREEMNANEVLNMELEWEEKFFNVWPHDYHGFDKRGHPIYYEKTATVDPDTLLQSVTIDQLKLCHTQMQETLAWLNARQTEKSGKMTYKSIIIMDMYDFGRKHLSGKFTDPLQEIIHIDQYFYPESLYKLFLINAPWVFKMLWKIVKPWLHPLTAARIEITGEDYLPLLEELIDRDQIPRFLGGECECCTDEGLEHQMDSKLEKFRAWREERLALLEDSNPDEDDAE